MKKFFLPYLVMSLLSLPAFSQTDDDTTALLGLPGDNLDLYAVLTLFQKSKTIEAFEKDPIRHIDQGYLPADLTMLSYHLQIEKKRASCLINTLLLLNMVQRIFS